MNQISDLNKLNYQSSIYVIGSAPTLKLLKNYNHLDGVKIGVGDVPWRAPEFGKYDYWVTSNPGYPLPWIPKHLEHLISANCQILLSSASVCLVRNRNKIDSTIEELKNLSKKIPLTFFDQRHFEGADCAPVAQCCYFSRSLITDKSIQELLSMEVGLTQPAYSDGDSVTLHALALAVLLQPVNIYVIGVEIPLVYKNYKYYKDFKVPFEQKVDLIKRILKRYLPKHKNKVPATSHNQIRFFHDFQKIVNIANQLNIKVHSLSPFSPINFINGVEYLEP